MIDPQAHDEALDYVLGALDPDAATAFERRMSADPALHAEVRTLEETLGALAMSIPTRPPPPELRNRVMARARASGSGGTVPPGEVTPLRLPARPPSRRPLTPWIAAAAGLILGLVGVMGYLDERGARIATEEELFRTSGQNMTLASEAARLDSLLAVLAGPDVRVATLASTDQPPSGRLHWDPTRGAAVLVAFQLPPAPSGRTYQAWGINPGEDPVSLGTFTSGPDGRVLVTLSGPVGREFALGAVTEEPAGGSPVPTSAPFLVGTLGP